MELLESVGPRPRWAHPFISIAIKARPVSKQLKPGYTCLVRQVSYNSHMASAGRGSENSSQAQDSRLIVDAIPTLAWSARSDGTADFFNQRWLEYTGLSAEQARDWGWTVALHSDDLNGLVNYWRSVLASDVPGEIEGRLRRSDGVCRPDLPGTVQ